ncbi:hypothetical protein P1X15_28085 [Runella sp. MFBS21]|uniref:glycoside hydrolase family 130 protein n=1 Tax=Runella sp. MFBS21 TaxID=3034018 RepID=UPI0023F89EDA|nr:hypothetical protein [Runella sp. MFBS21]MDF7821511.1 hypothetical protein [Runella sp. MFBS21]
MLEVKKEGIVLKKTHLGFESEGVLNPAIIEENGLIYLFYRAVSKKNYSTIGYCTFSSPLTLHERSDTPILYPQFDYESQGIEDPRIVKIDELYYLTYTAYDGVNALGALAISNDLQHFEKKGIITPQIMYEEFEHLTESRGEINEKYSRYNIHEHMLEKNGKKVLLWDKNVVFFPRRINGKLFFLHRIKPDIQIAEFYELSELTPEFWQNYFLRFNTQIVLSPRFEHEVSYIGSGCPPLETELGWLLIYHSVHDTINGYVYTACAALLDLQNPYKEIARLPYPLFKPEYDWEITGEVNNVCFPTGALVRGDTLYIYYGAADEQIACASLSIAALLEEFLLNSTKND